MILIITGRYSYITKFGLKTLYIKAIFKYDQTIIRAKYIIFLKALALNSKKKC